MSITLGLTSIIFSSILITTANNFFINKKWRDEINERSSHVTSATRSGGIAIFLSFFIISLYFYFQGVTLFDYSIIVPLSLLTFIGCYDDIYNLDFKLKFIFQIIAAKIIVDNGLLIDNFHGVLGIFEINRVFAQFLTIFIIISIINSINFIDGIDGLAISIFLVFIIAFEFFSNSNTPFINFSIIMISTIIPLFYFNFRRTNKVFLGDSGSHLMGGIVSIYTVYILSNNYLIKEQYDLHKILFVISILSYPIIDLVRIFCLRIYKGNSPFIADKNHIHHILQSKLKSHLKVLLVILLSSLSLMLFIQLLY